MKAKKDKRSRRNLQDRLEQTAQKVELLRRIHRLTRQGVDLSWDLGLRQLLEIYQRTRAGEVTEAEAVRMMDQIGQEAEACVEAALEALPDIDKPGPLMAHRTEKEVELKSFSLLAQFLAYDAADAAHRGLSDKEWEAEVWGSECWQDSTIPWRGRIKKIYTREISLLRDQGPWPWPRE